MNAAWAAIITAIIVALAAAVIGYRRKCRSEAQERKEAQNALYKARTTIREMEKEREQYALQGAYMRGIEDGRTSDTIYRQFLKQTQEGRAVCAIQKERR